VTPIDVASIYESLEEVNWNIMIPVSIHETQSRNVTISFQEQVELTPASRIYGHWVCRLHPDSARSHLTTAYAY
jgi:hypothetical protein